MTPQQQTLIKIVSEICKSNLPIDLSTKVIDLSLDSLDFLEMHMKIEDTFFIELSVDTLLKCNTVNDIFELIDSKLNNE